MMIALVTVCVSLFYKRRDDDDPSCTLPRLGARITACSFHTKSVKLSLFTRPPPTPPARARRPALANHQCLPLLLDHQVSEVFHELGQFLSQLLLLRSDAGAPTVLVPASVAFTQLWPSLNGCACPISGSQNVTFYARHAGPGTRPS